MPAQAVGHHVARAVDRVRAGGDRATKLADLSSTRTYAFSGSSTGGPTVESAQSADRSDFPNGSRVWPSQKHCFCDSLQAGRQRHLCGVNWRAEIGRLLRQEIDLSAPLTLVGLHNGVTQDLSAARYSHSRGP